MTTEAIITARFSPRPDEDVKRAISNEFQIAECRRLCERLGLTVIAVFQDVAKSGATMDDREEFHKALAMAIERKATLVFWDLERVTRNQEDGIALFKKLHKHRVPYLSCTETLKGDTADDRFLLGLKLLLGQREREKTAERTSSRMKFRQSRGERMVRFDRCPYGWQPDPNSERNKKGLPGGMVQVKHEQEVINRIVEESIKGKSALEIAADLRADGKTYRRSKFRPMHVHKILARQRRS